MRKTIALDGPTQEFLRGLRGMRENAGLSQRELCKALNISRGTFHMYELGLNNPSLGMLMRLAEYFGYDLSDSVNYKVYHGKLTPADIKRTIRRYGLDYRELSRLTGYNFQHISQSVNMSGRWSAECLSAVLEVLRHERELERFRTKRVLSGYWGGGR
ncbi:MAG: helix-turn-helix transcriptional regulator [Synergistaceae bacterium]|nr:helix-turn-helix transcriptional regulator [Synergistaceae bacterium]